MAQLDLPEPPASHVIVNRSTGKAVQECFGRKPILAAQLAADYEVLPILDWLHRVNLAARTG